MSRRAILALAVLLGIFVAPANAQILPRPSPTPTAVPTPTPTAVVVTPAPTPSPTPDRPPIFGTPEPSASPSSAPTPTPFDSGALTDPDPFTREVTGGYRVPIIRRTSARNTRALVDSLMRAAGVGLDPQELLNKGMGRFPIAGLVAYSDDWWNPRYTPVFHLHEGLDMFADFGTPIKSPDRGVVTRVTNGPVGGIGVWVRGSDGTQYYFAHLQFVENGIKPGTAVEVGTLLGGVGDTGNARGGAPHLHFEVHRPGPIPPKPLVDSWLDEAIANADAFVNALVDGTIDKRRLLRSESARAAAMDAGAGRSGSTPEYAAVAAILDPLAGGVGMVSTVPITPAEVSSTSGTLAREFVRQRVDGAILRTILISDGNPQGDGSG